MEIAMSDLTMGRESSGVPATSTSNLYRAVWRWHFYAGMLVLPFLLVLAVTGMIMLYGNSVETFLGPRYSIAPGGERAGFVDQANAAQKAVPDGTVKMLVVPAAPDVANVVVVTAGGKDHVVSLDPHGPAVLGSIIKDDTWFYWADKIHGTLLIGDVGDWIQEIAAGLGIVLVLTGVYLWWPRNRRDLRRALLPNLAARGRPLWRELHQTTGFFLAIVLIFFFVTGLAWTGVWGKKIVQAWSTFPAEKWDNVPLSNATHADMNHGAHKEVPWALEQTPLPASGSKASVDGVPTGVPVNLESIAALARRIGFDEQFRINVPVGKEGVYTISADSMDGDTANPMGDRTVHIDQYTGKMLAEVRFADYSPAGKAMAVGIALHQGNLGLWNTIVNLAFCLAVIFMAVSGAVMWWKRRPAGRIGVPAYPRNYRAPAAIVAIAGAVCVLLPLTGLAVIIFGLIDYLLPKRFKEVGVVQG
jgi:uncharacterized iron-regulated membrane protein